MPMGKTHTKIRTPKKIKKEYSTAIPVSPKRASSPKFGIHFLSILIDVPDPKSTNVANV